MGRYRFDFLGELYDIEIIGKGTGVRARHFLNQHYGHGRWRKMKGKAIISYDNGEVWLAEVHWFEAQGIGQRDHKVVYHLKRMQ